MTKYSIEKIEDLLPLVENIQDSRVKYKIYSNLQKWVNDHACNNIQKQILSEENRNKERS